MKSSGLEVICAEVIECEAEKIKQAVIRVERLCVRAVDTQILRKYVEKLAELLLRLLAIFDVDHVSGSAGDTLEACVLAQVLLGKGARPSFPHILHQSSLRNGALAFARGPAIHCRITPIVEKRHQAIALKFRKLNQVVLVIRLQH